MLALLPVTAQAASPTAVIRLEPYRKTVALLVEANGRSGRFLLDTAGGITLVSPDFAKAAGCVAWGQVSGVQMSGTRLSSPRCDRLVLSASGTRLEVPVAGVADLAALQPKSAAPIDGSLALDAFAGRTITIDFAGGILIVESRASARERIKGARALPVSLSREVGGLALAALIHVPTPRGVLRFELDSGNGGTLLVSKPFAPLFGLKPDAIEPQPGTIPIAPGIAATGLVFTPDIIIDGNLGMPFLKDWVVTLDLAGGRLWLKPTRATPPAGMGAPPVVPQP